MGYGAPRLLEVKMASKIDFGATWGGFGGHVGLEIGKFGTKYGDQVASKTDWKRHLKIIIFEVGLEGGQNF